MLNDESGAPNKQVQEILAGKGDLHWPSLAPGRSRLEQSADGKLFGKPLLQAYERVLIAGAFSSAAPEQR